ncbi:TPA: hypothetical protein U2E05_001897 [Streptococcus suis]|nr:hypothetical protein [Streptococcus suis]
MKKTNVQITAEITASFHEEILKDYHSTSSDKTFAEHVAEFYTTIYHQVNEVSKIDPSEFIS